jgi:G3E family GTPase
MITNPNKVMQKIPVSLVAGFLGSGKTTLLNRIIHQQQGLKIGVLVNDFGEVNIDAQLISNIDGETISLSNGCICCTIRDDLVAAVVQMTERQPAPDYIVIETSGVSEPNAAAMSLVMSTTLAARTQLDAIITVVDADQVQELEGNDRHLAVDQIRVADIAVINKTDLVNSAQLDSVQQWINGIAPRARTLYGSYCQVPLELLLGAGSQGIHSMQAQPACEAHADHAQHEHADHSESYSSLSWTDDKPLGFEAIYQTFSTLPLDIFRAKGILYLQEVPDKRVMLQMVGKRVMLAKGEPWDGADRFSQIVVIGKYGCVDKQSLEAQFRACQSEGLQNGDNPFTEAIVQILRRG